MRPLAILHVHLGARDGCAERQTAALLAGLGRRGHRTLGLVPRGSGAERRSLEAGAPIFPLGPRFPSGPGGRLTWWSRERARRLVARGAWELIHYHDPLAAGAVSPIVAGVAGAASPASRTVVTYRGRGARSFAGELAALRRHHRAGGAIVAASEALWSALVRQGFDEEGLSYIHPGIDIPRFARDPRRRAEARRELGLAEGDEAVGTVVVLDRDRGVRSLLEAMARLRRDRPAARLVVVGDGPGRRALLSASRSGDLEGAVIFTGWREDVPALLQALDVFVYAGEGGEVFPVSLIEAMAAGLPVVVSDQPGIREILENGKQGLFVPGRGSEAMARTIHRVLADRAEGERMARAGAVRVQRFHTQAMIDAHEALYYKVSKIPREG